MQHWCVLTCIIVLSISPPFFPCLFVLFPSKIRVVTKCTFVGDNFTRKAPKYERFIRPTGLRMKKANVTHPELKTTFQLDILGVKKNPSSSLYTNLGVMTKGTIIEVNVSELGLVTTSGKVAWGKMAQVTNNPELDVCVNAVLLV